MALQAGQGFGYNDGVNQRKSVPEHHGLDRAVMLGKGKRSTWECKQRAFQREEGKDVPTPPPPSLDTLFHLTLKNRGETEERQ